MDSLITLVVIVAAYIGYTKYVEYEAIQKHFDLQTAAEVITTIVGEQYDQLVSDLGPGVQNAIDDATNDQNAVNVYSVIYDAIYKRVHLSETQLDVLLILCMPPIKSNAPFLMSQLTLGAFNAGRGEYLPPAFFASLINSTKAI